MEAIEVKQSLSIRNRIIIVCLFLLIVGICWIIVNGIHPKVIYNGWLTGLLSDKSGTVLVVYDPKQNTMKEITRFENVSADNYAVVNSTGKKIAYTRWNQAGTKRSLVIQSLDSLFGTTEKEYFKDVLDNQEVKYLSWFPDGKRLLYIKNNVATGFANQEINVLDTETDKITTISKGGIWDGRNWIVSANGKNGKWKDYMSQVELDQLVKRYGGKPIPLEKASRKMWVEFSAPTISPDGTQIAYSAILYRNFADQGEKLWIASGIWIADVNGENSKLVYVSQDDSTFGRVVWSKDGNHLTFVRYVGMNGENGRVEWFSIKDNLIKTIVPVTNEHFTNLEPIPLDNNEVLFISVPKNGLEKDAKRLIVNSSTGQIREPNIMYNGKKEPLWRFLRIN